MNSSLVTISSEHVTDKEGDHAEDCSKDDYLDPNSIGHSVSALRIFARYSSWSSMQHHSLPDSL